LGLFLPSAWCGVDLEGIADCMTDAGLFYPSMHFSWHFDQVDHEIARPLYLQASLMNDLFKVAALTPTTARVPAKSDDGQPAINADPFTTWFPVARLRARRFCPALHPD
jgi:hypothetical protein